MCSIHVYSYIYIHISLRIHVWFHYLQYLITFGWCFWYVHVYKYTIRGSYIVPNPVSWIGWKFKRVDLGQQQTFWTQVMQRVLLFFHILMIFNWFLVICFEISWHVTISIRFTKCSNIFTTNTNPNHHSSNKSSCCLAGGLSTNGKCHGSRGSALGRRGANPFRPHGRSGWSKSQDQNFSLYHGRPFPCYAIQHVTQPDPLAVVKIGNKHLTATRWYEQKKYENMIITCTILY